jgi:D-alanyl-D-alanine carboxypeptidase/D-alanyl-D-alanine-endopeptidase (penicillin-binding protein 4)
LALRHGFGLRIGAAALAMAAWFAAGRTTVAEGAQGVAAIGASPPEAVAARLNASASRVLKRKELDGATVGIDVRLVPGGERVWSRQPESPLGTASNLKVMTIYLALATLGPAFHWETPLLVDAPIAADGSVAGNLWVRGSGDPTLQPCFFESEDEWAAVEPFVQALALHGVKRIAGDLVVDARAFDEEWVPRGWPADQLAEDYSAPVSALSLNQNRLRVRLTPRADGRLAGALRPEAWGWSVASEVGRAADRDEFRVGVLPPDAAGVIRVRGTAGAGIDAANVETNVADPPDWFGRVLRAALGRAGIEMTGTVRRPAPGPGGGERPNERAQTLYARQSPLLPALLLCGKESDNQIAEHLLKTCALVRFGRGTVANGARLVAELARDLGVDPAPVSIADGSGLSRDDRVPPELLTAVLVRAWSQPWRDEFVRCWPISGVDGSLDRRMTEPAMQYRVRAKTGYIARVSGLTGYALAGPLDAAETYAFSILINGFRGGNAEMKRVQDDLCRALVGAAAR